MLGGAGVPDRWPVLVKVLGPVEAISGGELLDVGGRLEKMLLGTLAVSANRAVSIDAIALALWGDHPPASRNNTVQTYVSRLRAALGGTRIRSEDHSYQLVVTPEELDSLEFERLAAEAEELLSDPERCASVCQRALGLWRGRPFGDFADADPFRLEVIRLEEMRLAVMEIRLGAEIALGHEALVCGTLESLVLAHPYRERFWELLVLALALSGRRVEALRRCTDLRAVLGELGLEPGSRLLMIEDAILREVSDLRSSLSRIGNGDALASA